MRNISDYSPFGVLLPERTTESAFYRKGFQGQERDDEVKGEGNSVNFAYRMHDPRVGRFFAVDPLSSKYPYNSSYAFIENVVIDHIEFEGLEKARPEEKSWAYRNPYDAYKIAGTDGKGGNRKVAEDVTNRMIIKQVYFENHGINNPGGVTDGQGDAFRHTYWNALNAADIGSTEAADFATLHELGETSGAIDPNSPYYDPIAVQMDLHNNYIGRRIADANPDATETELKNKVIDKTKEKNGMVRIKMDENGNYLDQDGNITTDVTKKVIINYDGSKFKGTLQGQKGYKPDFRTKSKSETKDYNGDDGEY
jgi:RHS repeat-associated protein